MQRTNGARVHSWCHDKPASHGRRCAAAAGSADPGRAGPGQAAALRGTGGPGAPAWSSGFPSTGRSRGTTGPPRDRGRLGHHATGHDWATTRAHLGPPHFTAPHSPLAEASQVAPPLSPSPGWRHPPQCPPQGRAGPEGEGRERGLTVCTGETSDGLSDHPLPSTSQVPGRPLSRLSRPGDEVTGRAHPVLQSQSLLQAFLVGEGTQLGRFRHRCERHSPVAPVALSPSPASTPAAPPPPRCARSASASAPLGASPKGIGRGWSFCVWPVSLSTRAGPRGPSLLSQG